MKIFDGHNDTLTRIYMSDAGRSFFDENESGVQIDLPRAHSGGFGGGFFAIFTPPPPDSPERDPMEGLTFTENGYIVAERSPVDNEYAQAFTDEVIDFAYELETVSGGSVKIVQTAADFDTCFAHDTLVMVLHLEGAEAILPDLSNLAGYYQRGVRSIGPVWSRPNAFAHGVPFMFPHSPDTGPGLTEAGRALIRGCNDLGILIDLAHLNEKGFFDVAALSTAPLVVTHADVFAICPSSRNLTDAQIDAIAASGGVIGINFEAMNTSPNSSVETSVPLTQITQHIDYIVNRVGIEHVAFGSDFDGAEMPDDINHVGKLPNLIATLRATGYDEAALEKIAYKNWLRIFKATWKN